MPELFQYDFTFRDLIQEDWRDVVTSFFFPKAKSLIKDPTIRAFVASANAELNEPGQRPDQITLMKTKAIRFFENNIEILVSLL